MNNKNKNGINNKNNKNGISLTLNSESQKQVYNGIDRIFYLPFKTSNLIINFYH